MKMYVLVRRDLSPGQQAVQGGHALAEFLLHRKTDWNNGTLVYLGVKDLRELLKWMKKFDQTEIPYSVFHEPDIGNEPTALATNVNSWIVKGINLL
jgi:peptidyl-tRNA hydrolase